MNRKIIIALCALCLCAFCSCSKNEEQNNSCLLYTSYKGMNKPQISTDTVDYVLSGSTLLKLNYDNDGRCLSKQVLTNEYPCIISDKVETIEDLSLIHI